jgi:hypothetical protein
MEFAITASVLMTPAHNQCGQESIFLSEMGGLQDDLFNDRCRWNNWQFAEVFFRRAYPPFAQQWFSLGNPSCEFNWLLYSRMVYN